MKHWQVALALMLSTIVLGSIAGCKDWIEARGVSTDSEEDDAPIVSERPKPPVDVNAEETAAPEEAAAADNAKADEVDEADSKEATDVDVDIDVDNADEDAPRVGATKPDDEDEDADIRDDEDVAVEADEDADIATRAISVEDHLLGQCVPDLTIALEHVRQAAESAAEEELTDALASVQSTELALGFARCEIPSVLVRQNLERAISRIQKGDSEGAEAALDSAVALAQEVELDGSLRDFRKAAGVATDLIAANSGTDALVEIADMIDAVKVDESEETLATIGENLLGARQALDRGVGTVAEAELKEARGKLLSLLEDTDAAE